MRFQQHGKDLLNFLYRHLAISKCQVILLLPKTQRDAYIFMFIKSNFRPFLYPMTLHPDQIRFPQTRRKNDELFHCFYCHCRPKELDAYFPYNSGKKYQNCGNFCARGDKKIHFLSSNGHKLLQWDIHAPPPTQDVFWILYNTYLPSPAHSRLPLKPCVKFGFS